jgi:hypothetical protein
LHRLTCLLMSFLFCFWLFFFCLFCFFYKSIWKKITTKQRK